MRNTLIAIVAFVIFGSVFAAYFYWLNNQPKHQAGQAQAAPASATSAPLKPVMRQVIDTPLAPLPLPALAHSDDFMIKALTDLIQNKSLINIFHTERIIHNITATIDNLTYRRTPMRVMPVETVSGKFLTAGTEDDLIISPMNAERYSVYVEIAEEIDTRKLVELYVRLYPLFQRSYEELGYPKKYFNDRLITVLDNLLAAPDIKEPVKLLQSNLYYQYADPDLEGRSIGQRILMRLGSNNEAKVKTKLQAIKQELILHMHEKIVGHNVGIF